MRIETVGTVSVSKTSGVIKDVVNDVMERANLPKDIKYKIKNLTCDVVFMVDGVPQTLTVNHGGKDELFTVVAKLDKKGNVEKAVNNEKESFIDDYTRAVVNGETKEYKEFITSEYSAEELEFISEIVVEDKKEIVYRNINTNQYVLQYYVGENLVGENTTHEIPQEHLTK